MTSMEVVIQIWLARAGAIDGLRHGLIDRRAPPQTSGMLGKWIDACIVQVGDRPSAVAERREIWREVKYRRIVPRNATIVGWAHSLFIAQVDIGKAAAPWEAQRRAFGWPQR